MMTALFFLKESNKKKAVSQNYFKSCCVLCIIAVIAVNPKTEYCAVSVEHFDWFISAKAIKLQKLKLRLDM